MAAHPEETFSDFNIRLRGLLFDLPLSVAAHSFSERKSHQFHQAAQGHCHMFRKMTFVKSRVVQTDFFSPKPTLNNAALASSRPKPGTSFHGVG